MDSSGSAIDFTTFGVHFLRYYCELGLSRWSIQHPHGERRLQLQDFVTLNQNASSICHGHRIKNNLFKLFFDKIDTDHDGWISFAQFIHWIKHFLAAAAYNELDFYLEEDDVGLDKGDGSITP